ncbi:MAG: gliding motility-associated C-terminal domain-containing protein [Flavobacteriales bacterium]
MISFKHFLILLSLFFYQLLSAQSTNKIAYMTTDDVGYLDMVFSPPTASETASTTVAAGSEGIVHVQNAVGQLLFYAKSDGVFAPDGTELPGSPALFGAAGITEITTCQVPGNPNQYYLFYTAAEGCSKLYSAKVDVTLGANGEVFQANQQLGDTLYAEGKEIIDIPNTPDKWLVVYKCTWGFERFKITETSISSPTGIKAFMPLGLLDPNEGGEGELDYHNERLAYASNRSNELISFPFNPCTGSGAGTLDSYLFPDIYGVEFSPTAQYIFATSDVNSFDPFTNTGGNLLRFNVQTLASTIYNLSGAFNCNGTVATDYGLGQIEMGTNRKLYTPATGLCSMVELSDVDNVGTFTIDHIGTGAALTPGMSDFPQSDAFINYIQFTSSVNNVSCKGGSDGSISISIEGGMPPYTVTWWDNSNFLNQTNLPTGYYDVTITDQSCSGQSVFQSIFVSEPEELTGSVETEDAKCFNGTGEIEYEAEGGTPPYTFSWSSGFNPNNPKAGNHSMLIQDAEGCVYAESFIIESPDEIQWRDSIINPLCFGEMGKVYIKDIIGGVAPYIVNNAPFPASGYLEFPDGTHEVKITDANNCKVSKLITIVQPQKIEVEITLEQDDNCNIFLAKGTATTSGGTGVVSIEWLGLDENNIGIGDVVVLATDENGCEHYEVTKFVPDETIYTVPTAFTPNADGVNDKFTPVMDCYRELEFKIYNRWGKLMFGTTEITREWDGKDLDGNDAPAESYIYLSVYRDALGLQHTDEGSLMLIR